MDHAAFRPDVDTVGGDAEELRHAPRFRLLIRAAKLITAYGEFVCVLRDVSATGVSVKLFHAMPECKQVELELQCGDRFEMECRWIRGREAGRSEEHTSELQSLMRISYAVFCLKKNNTYIQSINTRQI